MSCFFPTVSSVMYKDTGMVSNPGDRKGGKEEDGGGRREHKTVEHETACFKKFKSNPAKGEMSAVFSTLVVMEEQSVLSSKWQDETVAQKKLT